MKMTEFKKGKVMLVGAGPGDPDLLTLRAIKAFESASLILYDNLVSEDIRALFPEGTLAIYVGKCKDRHSIRQEDLNDLLVKWALQGKIIARVKGGDPFVFGRGSEEMLALRETAIDVEVIPGVTSASGCSTYSDFPLTHRGVSTGCTFVTAHTKNDRPLDWSALANLGHTLVFYMGLTKAGDISEGLVSAGLAESTPVALVENGCRSTQRTVVTDLRRLTSAIEENALTSPTLIYVGEVVALRAVLRHNMTTQQLAG